MSYGKSSERQDSGLLARRPRSRAFSCCHCPFLPSLRQRAQRHRAFPCPPSTPLKAFPCPPSTPLRASPSLPPRFRLPSPSRYDPCHQSTPPTCPGRTCPASPCSTTAAAVWPDHRRTCTTATQAVAAHYPQATLTCTATYKLV